MRGSKLRGCRDGVAMMSLYKRGFTNVFCIWVIVSLGLKKGVVQNGVYIRVVVELGVVKKWML